MGPVEVATDGVSDGAGRRHGVHFAGVGLRFLALAADLAVLSALGILGGILIISSPERARSGDRVACTRVVRANR